MSRRRARATCSRSASCSTSSRRACIRSRRRRRSARWPPSLPAPRQGPPRGVRVLPQVLERLLFRMLAKDAEGAAPGRRGPDRARAAGDGVSGSGAAGPVDRRPRRAPLAEPAARTHPAHRSHAGADRVEGHAARSRHPPPDADRARRDGEDAAGRAGGRRSCGSLRGRGLVREPRADRGLAAGGVGRGAGRRRP